MIMTLCATSPPTSATGDSLPYNSVTHDPEFSGNKCARDGGFESGYFDRGHQVDTGLSGLETALVVTLVNTQYY